ncbi:hypothetical protein A3D70_00210 [Candidatus Adlerbacteria bacterium RIFCSPHIGHO2_02_FULL_54_18]|uniref:Uncharacterized protein n=2 Tax=Candidatus Adleribacteriota TaxID=1752736 RepID=A0A1F4Y6E5_9BACT|nr:MAG: hypothetical protein A2949_02575 [Candidatus Adlerbacteria bacterium RIFCSPLOWO2_01_FULL_54_21b]OGC88843.1 MAG: hypothetical protein A3D70_00210 [Candidatus Adlerbacteria bacterium RIFCSPHIGHO2_02_FULL_54_18]
MIKSVIKTLLLVVTVLLLAQFVPLVAQYQTILIIAALAYGLFGFITRSLLILFIIAAAVAAYFLHLF